MSIDRYEEHDGLGLAALVRRGEVAPQELLDAALARIQRHNPRLNAVVANESALLEAIHSGDRVFCGLHADDLVVVHAQ